MFGEDLLGVPAGQGAAHLQRADQALDELLQARIGVSSPGWIDLTTRLMTEQIAPILRRQIGTAPHPVDYRLQLESFTAALGIAEPVLWRNELWRLSNDAIDGYPYAGRVWTPEMFVVAHQYWALETDNALEADSWLAQAGFTGIYAYLVGCADGRSLKPFFDGMDRDPTRKAAVFDRLRAAGGDPDAVAYEDWKARSLRGFAYYTPIMIWKESWYVPLVNQVPLGDAIDAVTARSAAKLDFLRSTIVEQASERAGRGARRRWTRQMHAEPPNVRVVSLRRRESHPAAGAGRPVDWQHRWFVRGHWRAQRVGPGRVDTRPTFIATYLKGPEDRPLLAQGERVFNVVR